MAGCEPIAVKRGGGRNDTAGHFVASGAEALSRVFRTAMKIDLLLLQLAVLFLAPPIIELRRTDAGMVRHLRRFF